MEKDILFKIKTPIGIEIRTTKAYWDYICTVKHRIMRDKLLIVKEILHNPDEIRKSKIDDCVYLYYRQSDKLYCAVCRHLKEEGYLVTAYPTDKIKEGEVIWKK